jgi:hypothetical protein
MKKKSKKKKKRAKLAKRSDIFYLNSTIPGKGSLSLSNYLLSTSYEKEDFTSVEEEIRKGDTIKAYNKSQELFNKAKDKKNFVFEYTIAKHEKRHFFDIISTPFGQGLFLMNWVHLFHFSRLISNHKRPGMVLKIPFRKWIELLDCPEDIIAFTKDVMHNKNYDKLWLYSGSPKSIRITPKEKKLLGKKKLLGGRSIIGEPLRPYIGFVEKFKIKMYPANTVSIFEGIAWWVQLINMAAFDAEIASFWWKRILRSPHLWMYFSVLKAARILCHDDPDETCKMIEFSLMTPGVVIWHKDLMYGFSGDEREFDPGWRFYLLMQYMIEHKPQSKKIETICQEFCENIGWWRPLEIITRTKTYWEEIVKSSDEIIGPVYNDFAEFANNTLNSRQSNPLLGIDYAMKFGFILPPIHRKILPNGKFDIRIVEDQHKSFAWKNFILLSSIVNDALNKNEIRCPYAIDLQGATFPGSGKCTCEANLSRCVMEEMFDYLGISFINIK